MRCGVTFLAVQHHISGRGGQGEAEVGAGRGGPLLDDCGHVERDKLAFCVCWLGVRYAAGRRQGLKGDGAFAPVAGDGGHRQGTRRIDPVHINAEDRTPDGGGRRIGWQRREVEPQQGSAVAVHIKVGKRAVVRRRPQRGHIGIGQQSRLCGKRTSGEHRGCKSAVRGEPDPFVTRLLHPFTGERTQTETEAHVRPVESWTSLGAANQGRTQL